MKIAPRDHVLFIGDSITNAFRMPAEVNDSYQLGAGYAMMVAARLRHDQPSLNLRFTNRGNSGHAVEDLAIRWRGDCLDLQPNSISILVGINDALRHKSTGLPEFRDCLSDLLRRTSAALPDSRILLCEPFASIGDHSCVPHEGFEALQKRQGIIQEIASSAHANFLPLQKLFDQAAEKAPPDYWLYDGIHPTAAGHMLIADAWLKTATISNTP